MSVICCLMGRRKPAAKKFLAWRKQNHKCHTISMKGVGRAAYEKGKALMGYKSKAGDWKMTKEDFNRDELVKNYLEDYSGKVFYFCVKKTGNSQEAEDLASDISLNILQAFYKGTVPEHFAAWVWRIARNRYSVWADRKRHITESMTGTDIGEYEIQDEKAGMEEEMVHGENLALMRRELAFLASDYRKIILAYYIEDRKTREIAAKLGLPQGTVESKLFRARKILKEGMEMAREFGTRSYKPEEVQFAASGNQPSGLPWSAVQRMLPKNILLEASNNPSTMEELSIELGIALPYMEEEVKLLLDATLLKQVGDKYVTDFFILSRECQQEIYQAQRKDSKERSGMLDTLISETLGQIRGLGVVRNGMADEELKWWAMIYGADYFTEVVEAYDIQCPVKRMDGGDWGFVGYEEVELPEKCGMGHNGYGVENTMLWVYKIPDYGMWNREGLPKGEDIRFLGEVVKNNRNVSGFTDSEKRIWKRLENRFAHEGEDGSVVLDVVLLEGDVLERIHEIWKAHPLYGKIAKSFQKLFEDTIGVLERKNISSLKEQLAYCASMCVLDNRMMIVHDEVEAGRLTVPEDAEHSKVAMALHIK